MNLDLIYNDDYQKKLEKDLIKIYKNINYDKNVIIDIKNIFNLKRERHKKLVEENKTNNKYIEKNDIFPLYEYIIKDNKLYLNEEIYKDERSKDNYDLISNTLKWCIKNNLKIPNTKLYIWISDKFPWNSKNFENFPIWVYARPSNIKLPIFPDTTFNHLDLEEKYSKRNDNTNDWDKIKNLILKKCKNIKKENLIYFKGTRTTNKNHCLRENLEKYQKNFNIPIKIDLDGWNTYNPIYNFCNYFILLNLPGRYPWSNRLKYLYLMNSVIINVNIKTININSDYDDNYWISFIDYVIDKKHYENLEYKYYRISGKYLNDKDNINKIKENTQKLQKKEFKKFTKKLQELYYKINNNIEFYKKKAKKTKLEVEKLTNERIYQYIYRGILLNSELIK